MADLSVEVTSPEGEKAGSVTLPESVFGFDSQTVVDHIPLIHQVVVAHLAALRQGTHAVKSRGTVSGGGKKPWRQKGTGRARQGSIRAPQWKGGAIAFGPVPRDYSQKTPKKMKALALKYVLSDRASAGALRVLGSFSFDKPSTKKAAEILAPIAQGSFSTLVLTSDQLNEWLSVRNLDYINPIFVDQINTYDVIVAKNLIFSKEAMDQFIDKCNAKSAAKER
ncbi:MAG: 50S ribosomal protein L4 [Aeriscardovia sp.]|nr:50S ribosomal protein L4 [Aeriscardovia sp.]